MSRRKNQIIFPVLAVLCIIISASCDSSKKYEREEAETIQAYLAQNSDLNFVLKSSGLYYYEELTGSGILPAKNDTALVRYTGMLLDGTIFDSNVSNSEPYPVPVLGGTTIAGFDEGKSYMREGGTSWFLIPSNLGYGANGTYWIPGYTPLLFKVELESVIPGPGK